MSENPEWFAPKRYGYGAGLPISVEGWALTLAFFVLVGLDTLLLKYSLVSFISILVIVSAAFIMISARTTRGGWRWRWGDED